FVGVPLSSATPTSLFVLLRLSSSSSSSSASSIASSSSSSSSARVTPQRPHHRPTHANAIDVARRSAHSDASAASSDGSSSSTSAFAVRPVLMVSNPDSVSHIRRIRFTEIPSIESESSREFRLLYLQAQDMHHRFWSANNEQFIRMREEFEEKIMEAHGRPASPMDFSSDSHMKLQQGLMLYPAARSEVISFLQGLSSILDRAGVSGIGEELRKELRSFYRHGYNNSYRAQGVSVR
ncbi:hypothetical protein BC829DRAFT_382876, partial [Chytridium lagenaria]